MLYLTQSAISEELNVVCQTELLHLRCRSLINHRVLNLHDRHIKYKYMVSRCTEGGKRNQESLMEYCINMHMDVLPGCLRCGCLCW